MLTLSLPTIPTSEIIEYKTIIDYTMLNTTTLVFLSLITGIPINYVVVGTALRIITSFNGAGISSITASIGAFVPDTALANTSYYLGPYELTQVNSPQSIEYSEPPNNDLTKSSSSYATFFSSPVSLFYNGPHDISVYFVAIGANVNVLTAGVLEATVQLRAC